MNSMVGERLRSTTIRTIMMILTLGFAILGSAGCAATRPAAPRLAVVMVVDMFPADLLERHRDLLADGGFNRLMRDGAYFTNAHFKHAATFTGPGNATIATGAHPSIHGIIANHWYEPGVAEPIDCVIAPATTLIGSSLTGDISGCSPRYLAAPTVADQLKRACGSNAKVWSCALKDRAAVLMVGENPDGVVWWTPETGNFISSTRYFTQLPGWCRTLNDERFADKFFDMAWDYALPVDRYIHCDVDRAVYEDATRLVWTNAMPKPLGKPMYAPNRLYYERLRASPFGNELVFEFGRRAVIHESLGADDVPDLLFLGLSSPDYAGHMFGPDSHEIADMIVRTDRQIADWLHFLDERVGINRYAVILTGDHGAGSAPEYVAKQGLDAGRIDVDDMFTNLNNALRDRFGAADDGLYYLKGINLPWAYLNEAVLEAKGIGADEASAVLAGAARRYVGVAAAFPESEFRSRNGDSYADLKNAIARSTYPGRSGNVYIHVKPNWHVSYDCCDHRSAHPYDTHVPLIFMGKAFRKGRFEADTDMCDLAVTLCACLNIDPPLTATGHALTDALRTR